MRLFLVAVLATTAMTTAAGANDLLSAPPAFDYAGKKAVPIDFRTVDLTMTFDATTSTTTAHATIEFSAEAAGYPIFDLVPTATSIELNGVSVPTANLVAVSDPNAVTRVRVLRSEVAANSVNEMKISYRLGSEVSYSSGTVRAGFFMNDLAEGGREFWEQYGPSNLEFDQFQMTMHVNLVGTAANHVIYTNGELQNTDAQSWTVVFPEYFTTSSFFFHLAPAGAFATRNSVFNGVEKQIPVTVYATSSSNADSGMSRALQVMSELENTYGAFAHARVVAYITPDGGGMEHCGATITSLGALGHELTHSWFARGVMPADGNAGWIDEATASWRDSGYPRAGGTPSRSPVNLGGFAPYRRHTTMSAYSSGKTLMSEFDYMFRNLSFEGTRGMRGILRQLFAEKKHETITVSFFHQFMETVTSTDLDQIFGRYVYGRGVTDEEPVPEPSIPDFKVFAPETFVDASAIFSQHPRPFTREELRRLR